MVASITRNKRLGLRMSWIWAPNCLALDGVHHNRSVKRGDLTCLAVRDACALC